MPPAEGAGDRGATIASGAEAERGREAVAGRSWLAAFDALTRADVADPLGAGDLEQLATAAYMLGRDDEYVRVLERAHHAYLEDGEALRAVRCAFWAGLNLLPRGETGPAMGWFGRAQRLLERAGRDCVEHGYLLIPVLLTQVRGGDCEAAYATACQAAEIGARFGDDDLVALVVQEQGHALIRQGRVEDGLRLLDETMVAVTAGELSPIVTGLVYCNTIAFCQSVFELRRAREWTSELSRWCERQPDMVAHTGVCLVHRAEILELQGAWPDALVEARRAGERFAGHAGGRLAAGNALYREAEVHRLRGAFDDAERAYRETSRHGREPQPGLALLRLAQGNAEKAAAAIRRVVDETPPGLDRARVLPACVEIMLAAGDTERAREAARELQEIAALQRSEVLGALAARARGEVALADGDARGALAGLRESCLAWQELQVPYEVARVRMLIGLACRSLGDADTAVLELDAARAVFEELGALPDLERITALSRAPAAAAGTHGLTAREVQVLRLVAGGATNKAIAGELVLSERTIDRHVSNILRKLGVPTRAAATAYAYEHALV